MAGVFGRCRHSPPDSPPSHSHYAAGMIPDFGFSLPHDAVYADCLELAADSGTASDSYILADTDIYADAPAETALAVLMR